MFNPVGQDSDKHVKNLEERDHMVIVPTEAKTVKPKKQVQAKPVQSEAVKVEAPKPKPVAPSSNEQLLAAADIPRSEWPAVDFIFTHESTWRPTAVNNIGCIGLGQSCPGGSGLASDCPNWQTDVICQIKHFDKYAKSVYGSWWGAHSAWQSKGWW